MLLFFVIRKSRLILDVVKGETYYSAFAVTRIEPLHSKKLIMKQLQSNYRTNGMANHLSHSPEVKGNVLIKSLYGTFVSQSKLRDKRPPPLLYQTIWPAVYVPLRCHVVHMVGSLIWSKMWTDNRKRIAPPTTAESTSLMQQTRKPLLWRRSFPIRSSLRGPDFLFVALEEERLE